MVEDYKRYFNKIRGLKLYLIKFDGNGKIKDKICPLDCIINNENR